MFPFDFSEEIEITTDCDRAPCKKLLIQEEKRKKEETEI